MTTEQTRQTMQAYADALLSFGDFARYLSDDATMTFMGTDRVVKGRDAVRDTIKFFHEIAFSSAIEVGTVVCGEGDAMLEAVFVGTHTGEFAGIPASGNPVRVPYSAFYDVADGKITALRLYMSLDELVRQVGQPAAATTA